VVAGGGGGGGGGGGDGGGGGGGVVAMAVALGRIAMMTCLSLTSADSGGRDHDDGFQDDFDDDAFDAADLDADVEANVRSNRWRRRQGAPIAHPTPADRQRAAVVAGAARPHLAALRQAAEVRRARHFATTQHRGGGGDSGGGGGGGGAGSGSTSSTINPSKTGSSSSGCKRQQQQRLQAAAAAAAASGSSSSSSSSSNALDADGKPATKDGLPTPEHQPFPNNYPAASAAKVAAAAAKFAASNQGHVGATAANGRSLTTSCSVTCRACHWTKFDACAPSSTLGSTSSRSS
jgi:hypothetical protein